MTVETSNPMAPRRSRWRHLIWVALAVFILVAAGVAGLFWYASTPQFAARVHRSVVAAIERATGGKVEMRAFHWSARDLAIQIDDLTIHGKEAPGQIPYFHVDQLLLHAKILSFFLPRIALASLTADRPTLHLILYPNGTTNQPEPRVRNSRSLPEQVLNLAIGTTRIRHGLVLLNDRPLPWEMAAGPLRLTMKYSSARAEYHARVETGSLIFRLKKYSQTISNVTANLVLGRNAVGIENLDLTSGPSHLTASGQLQNFSNPRWQAAVHGSVDLRQIGEVTGQDELRNGTAQVNLQAQGQPGRYAEEFRVSGHVDLKSAALQAPWLRLRNVDLHTNLLFDNQECSLTDFSSVLEDKSRIDGSLVLKNCFGPSAPVVSSSVWRGRGQPSKSWLVRHPEFNPRNLLARLHHRHIVPKQAQSGPPTYQPLQADMHARIYGVTLPMVMAAVAPREYWNIGFTTATSGEVIAHWAGEGHGLDVHGNLTMAAPRQLNGLIPVVGSAHADYLGDHHHLVIEQADESTPATHVTASGLLTLFTKDLNSNLRLDVTGRDLADFDRLLTDLNLRVTPKNEPNDLPLKLLGPATFHGNVHGSFFALEAIGHLDANRFQMLIDRTPPPGQPAPPIRRLTWDGFHADLSYSPAELIVTNAELLRGHSVIHTALDLLPDRTGPNDYTFNRRTRITAAMRTSDASVADLQSAPGSEYPVVGELTASAHIAGVVDNLEGSGQATLTHANVRGQPVRAASMQLNVHGQVLEATHIKLAAASGTAAGQFTWDYTSGAIKGALSGQHFALSHIALLQSKRLPIDGTLGFHLQTAGTIASPIATGALQVQDVALDDQPMGSVHAAAHLQQGTVTLTSRADLMNARIDGSGHIDLTGNDPAQAQLTFNGFDPDPLIRTLVSPAVDQVSALSGSVIMSGPLLQFSAIRGDANLKPVSFTFRRRAIHSASAIHLSLQNGKLQLLPLQIEGKDMNLVAGGTVDLLHNNRLRLHSEGTIDSGLAAVVSPAIQSSGQIRFVVNANGTARHPDLRGRAQVVQVSLHLPNVSNGLTNVNGELLFDQDRMVVQQLTGSSGGGRLQMKGFVGYQNGLFVDLTATSNDVRIRYPKGISSVVDSKLRLLGSSDNLLLSGNAKITRFGIGSSVDLASLAGSGGGVSAPIDPASPLNRVRLDIHVTSAPEVGFQNSFASLAGDVNLRIRGTLADPSVLGRIDITQGAASFAGTKYRLRQGDIVFNNPVTISPEVDLEAAARVQNYDIIISLHGPPSKLDITYRSEPPLTQADVLALLALGRTNEQATQYGEVQQQGANLTSEALLGGALNAAVSNRVQKLFGVGSVRVDPNFVGTLGQSTARITVEEQVGPSLTLTFATSVNTTAQQLLQAQYDLTRNVSIIAVRDEANVFSMYLQIRARHK